LRARAGYPHAETILHIEPVLGRSDVRRSRDDGGDPDRDAKIGAIVSDLSSLLAPYDVTIVATRPTSAGYSMIVMTDDNASVVGQPAELPAATRSTCNMRTSPVSFEFGYGGSPEELRRDFAVRNALARFADQAAIPLSKKHGDCMCFVNDACWIGSLCTIGGAGTPIDPTGGCPTSATEVDEADAFLQVFGARL
jgi:hypothetical protein